MMNHERESMEMANKLTLMKNQIMENDIAYGMMKRHPAVRLGKIRHHPCTIEFVQGEEEDDYFMVIDGRHETITINLNNIDQFSENEETGRMMLVYHVPAEPSTFNRNAEGMVKRKDEFECAENELLLKAFSGIRNKLATSTSESFNNPAADNIQAAAAQSNEQNVSITKQSPKPDKRSLNYF